MARRAQGERKSRLGIDRAVNLLLGLAAVSVLLAPSNPLIQWIRREYSDRQVGSMARDAWEDLIREGGRVGDGPVLAVEFADYQCPYCRRFHRANDPATCAGSVVYRHYPITTSHPYAESAALAAICAEELGVFEKLHAYLLENDQWDATVPDWHQIVAEAEVDDASAMLQCMDSEHARARLERDVTLAEKLGVRATPTFIMPDGRIVSGAPRDGYPWDQQE